MAVRTGAQFLEGLRDGREIWLEGERVENVTTHPKLERMARTLASVYDLQHDPELHDQMTFTSPSSGEPVALSYNRVGVPDIPDGSRTQTSQAKAKGDTSGTARAPNPLLSNR